MEKELQIVPDTLTLLELSQMLAKGTKHQASLILNQAGDLVGLITRGDVIRAMESGAGIESCADSAAGMARTAITKSLCMNHFPTIDLGIMTCTPTLPSTSSVTRTSHATLTSR